MAEESSFNDLDYGMDRDRAILSDNNLDNDDSENTDSYNKVPDEPLHDDSEVVDSNVIDYVEVKRTLEEASKDFGIPVTAEMENYVVAMSATYDASGDSLMWFMAALSYQNNMKVIPSMINLIEDMRAEVKSLQSINRSLGQTSGDIVGRMKGIKDEVLSGFESLRRSVLDKITAIPTQLTEATGSPRIEPKPKDHGKGIALTRKPIPAPSSKQEWVKKNEVPAASPSEKEVGIQPTTSSAGALDAARIKTLQKLGASATLLKALPKSVMDKLLPASEMMILVDKWSSAEADGVREEVEIRLMELENGLLE